MRFQICLVLGTLLVLSSCSSEPGGSNGSDASDLDAAGDTPAADTASETDSSTEDDASDEDAVDSQSDTRQSSEDSGPPDDDVDPPPADECDDWQSRNPAWIWCDGFEEASDWEAGYGDVNDDDGSFSPSTDDAYRGSRSLEQFYTSGQVNAGWLGFQLGDAPSSNGEPARDHYFVRWYHKFEAGFEGAPPKMARVRRLAPDWDKEYGVHHWIADEDQVIVADIHAPDSTQANSSGWLPVARSDFSYADSDNVGRWICHEIEINNNSPGETDGHIRVWADGDLIIERTGVDLRGSRSDAALNEIMLDTYWNGGSPKEQSRFYDNFVISTERIGCL